MAAAVQAEAQTELRPPCVDCKDVCLKSMHNLGYGIQQYQQVDTPLVYSLITHALNLCKANFEVYACLQNGSRGQIFAARSRQPNAAGVTDHVIAKVQLLKKPEDITEFEREVRVHKQVCTRIQNNDIIRAPHIKYHYRFVIKDKDFACLARPNYKNHQIGVIVMDRVTGMLNDLLKLRYREEAFLAIIAKQLKVLLRELDRLKIIHGDLHFNNIGYTLHGSGLRLYVLDFGRTMLNVPAGFWDEVSGIDTFFVWRSSMFPGEHNRAFNRIMRSEEVGFPESAIAQEHLSINKLVYKSKPRDMTAEEYVKAQCAYITKLDGIFSKAIAPLLRHTWA